jgi:hypothetical protein
MRLRQRSGGVLMSAAVGLVVLSAGTPRSSGMMAACIRDYVDLLPGTVSSLNAVATAGRNDVWAVGTRGGGAGRPLVARYNGQKWRVTAVGPLARGELLDVQAISPNDVWAVGTTDAADPAGGRPAVIHWNGTRWRRVALPKKADGVGELSSAGRGDVWMLTYDENGFTLPLRWTGRRWQILKAGIPHQYASAPGGFYRALGIAVVSRRDSWIVGDRNDRFGIAHAYVARWNGRRWKTVRVPSSALGHLSGRDGEKVSSVASVGAKSVWAVGTAVSPGFTGYFTLRWDGTRWRLGRDPGGPAFRKAWDSWTGSQVSMAITMQGEGWLVAGGDAAAHETHGTWSSLPDPAPGVDLHGVSASGAGTAWAVGDRGASNAAARAVAERLRCPV